MVKKNEGKPSDRRPPPFPKKNEVPPPFQLDATRIDMGDDLLDTATFEAEALSSSSSVESAEDQLATAKILINEGLFEDAKKTLRKILIRDPDHQAASQALKDVQDNELRELLSGREPVTRKPRIFEREGAESRGPELSSEQVLQELESSLGDPPERRDTRDEPIVSQESIQDLTVSDRVDLGIAFMEMGAYEKAAEIFRTALHFIDVLTPEGQAKNIATNVLLARAYLDSDRSFEAIQVLHALVRNDEISTTDKVEFFYLMGLAHEMRKERKVALSWYGKVREIDPHFRDIRERLRKGQLKSPPTDKRKIKK